MQDDTVLVEMCQYVLCQTTQGSQSLSEVSGVCVSLNCAEL